MQYFISFILKRFKNDAVIYVSCCKTNCQEETLYANTIALWAYNNPI